MKSAASMCIASTLLVMVACAPSVSVNYDYDKNVDFTPLKNYAWLPPPEHPTGTVEAEIQRNSLLDSRIKGAVNDQLAAKGYQSNSEQPDILLTYHTGTKDKIDVTDWGYGYGPHGYGGWYGGGGMDVYQYTEGTLILDIIDADTKNLVWRGSMQGTLDPGASTEKREARIKDAVAKMMANYPPPKK
jgi:hypothetical protein